MAYRGDKRSTSGVVGWVWVSPAALVAIVAVVVCLPILTPPGHAQGDPGTRDAREAARRPDGPSATTVGGLIIQTTPPGAEILQGGKPLGAAGDLLTPGTGQVKLVIRKAGYRTETVSLSLPVDGAAATYRVNLRPHPGFVIITSEPPGAEIWRGEELLGSAGEAISLSAGTHVLRIAKTHHRDHTLDLVIPPGGRHVEHVKLAPKPGWLLLHSDPPGADVCEGDKVIGRVGERIPMAAGAHRLSVRKAKYLPRDIRVDIPPEGERVLAEPLVLEAKPGRIVVTAEPAGAAVWEANRRIGMVGEEITLAAGPHVLFLRLDGHADCKLPVDVPADGNIKLPLTRLVARPGRVLVTAVPADAAVFDADGNPVGTAGVAFVYPAGPHELEVRRQGYHSAKTEVTIPPGKLDVAVTVRLMAKDGRLRVIADPADAELFQDGARVGASGEQLVRRPGRLVFEVRRGGYLPQEVVVNLPPDGDLTQRVELTPRESYVTVRAIPADADVFHDGDKLGGAGEKLTIRRPGTYHLELRRAGYRSSVVEVTVEGGDALVVPEAPVPLAADVGELRVVAQIAEGIPHPARMPAFSGSLSVGDREWQDVTFPVVLGDVCTGETTIGVRVAGYAAVLDQPVVVEFAKVISATVALRPEAGQERKLVIFGALERGLLAGDPEAGLGPDADPDVAALLTAGRGLRQVRFDAVKVDRLAADRYRAKLLEFWASASAMSGELGDDLQTYVWNVVQAALVEHAETLIRDPRLIRLSPREQARARRQFLSLLAMLEYKTGRVAEDAELRRVAERYFADGLYHAALLEPLPGEPSGMANVIPWIADRVRARKGQ